MSMFKDYVGNLFSEVPKHPKSHVRGWSMHWAETIGHGVEVLSKETSLCDADTLFFDHGVNSEPGQMNLFGGITEQIVDRLEQVAENKTLAIVSLDAPMPVAQYVEGMTKRVGQSSCSPRLTKSLIGEIEKRLLQDRSNWMSQANLVKTTVCIGDSHSTAYAASRQPVIKKNGLTLHHAVTKGYLEEVLDSLPPTLDKVTLVLGSIDIRHHIGLDADPVERALDLSTQLVEFAAMNSDLTFELAVPVPIEFEGRRIPKTGWLNGRPFTGSIHNRERWVEVFRDTFEMNTDIGYSVISPPLEWYSMDPEDYAKEHMELASSVHIAPPSYRRYGGWFES